MFIVDRKVNSFKTELLKHYGTTIIGGLLDRVLLQIQILKLPVIVAFLNFSGLVGRKALENADFKVLGRSVYKACATAEDSAGWKRRTRRVLFLHVRDS